MKAVVQRVTQSTVTVGDETIGSIGQGLMILLGVGHGDTADDCRYLADKIVNLRIFEDNNGKMNLSLLDIKGEMLVVSQFTLLGDCRKGRRPSFIAAAPPEPAEAMYATFCESVRQTGVQVATGRFGAMMKVSLVNDGPVTLILESKPKAS
jgi:D-tyrosyl-tRNA(Tyr) deacylase